MTANIEDSDMKIVGKTVPGTEDVFDAIKFIEETRTQRFNGNTAKAKALGANIVSAFSYKAAPFELVQLAREYDIEVDDDTLLQIKILSVFSAEYCLNKLLPSAMLSATAVNELYDVLEKVSPDFCSELSQSIAFSFYYLCLKNSSDDALNIGEQFAMLCGKKGDASFSALGKKLHEINVNVYTKAINGFAFV